ncbi:MAG: sigma 54-interacting transcriptional regulator, partial [Proteobacteria bacterium]|nr:sigma 54-interacting transcriptional regulator [Pseudomonadota bacterium]
TNRKLEKEVQNGNFRQDLYYRINVVEIAMPPLREHKEDIPLLVNHFLEKMIKRLSRRATKFSADSIRLLVDYQWPGNVRELENVVERALILGSQDPIIEPDQLPPNIQILADNKKLMLDEPVDQLRLDVALARFSKVHICKVLESVKGDKKDAAKILGLGLSSLYRKLDEFSIGSKSV